MKNPGGPIRLHEMVKKFRDNLLLDT